MPLLSQTIPFSPTVNVFDVLISIVKQFKLKENGFKGIGTDTLDNIFRPDTFVLGAQSLGPKLSGNKCRSRFRSMRIQHMYSLLQILSYFILPLLMTSLIITIQFIVVNRSRDSFTAHSIPWSDELCFEFQGVHSSGPACGL